MNRPYAEFGIRLRYSRLAAHLSQQQLAQRVGLSRASIANIESGRQQVLLHTAIDLADAVGKPLLALLPRASGEEPLELTQPNMSVQGNIDRTTHEWVSRVVGNSQSSE